MSSSSSDEDTVEGRRNSAVWNIERRRTRPSWVDRRTPYQIASAENRRSFTHLMLLRLRFNRQWYHDVGEILNPFFRFRYPRWPNTQSGRRRMDNLFYSLAGRVITQFRRLFFGQTRLTGRRSGSSRMSLHEIRVRKVLETALNSGGATDIHTLVRNLPFLGLKHAS